MSVTSASGRIDVAHEVLADRYDIFDANRLRSMMVYATAEYRNLVKTVTDKKDLVRARKELNNIRTQAQSLQRDFNDLGAISRRFVQMADANLYDSAVSRVIRSGEPAMPEDPLMPSASGAAVDFVPIRQEYIQKSLMVLERIAQIAADSIDVEASVDRRVVALDRWVWILARFWENDLERDVDDESAGPGGQFSAFLHDALMGLDQSAAILLPYALKRYVAGKL